MFKRLCAVTFLLVSLAGVVLADERRFPAIGQSATAEEIAAWDIAIGPNGEELPAGAGSVDAGRQLYASRCAHCHGKSGAEGPDHRLVGGHGSLTGEQPVLTIGSYWPYATTVFDYIRRAMPFLTPGSLSSDDVYALTAYLLFANNIIDEETIVNRDNLPSIAMPNRNGFIKDPRPENFRNNF